jgi:hypothetical protein
VLEVFTSKSIYYECQQERERFENIVNTLEGAIFAIRTGIEALEWVNWGFVVFILPMRLVILCFDDSKSFIGSVVTEALQVYTKLHL